MRKNLQEHYQQVLAIAKLSSIYNSIQYLLHWDQETYMPRDAIKFRSLQIEAMASLAHKQRTSKKFVSALGKLIDLPTGEILDPELLEPKRAALREWRRDYLQSVKLPVSFVRQLASTSAQATHVWAQAKQQNDFKAFAPYLAKIVSLNRKKADILGYEGHPYDALLELYEPYTSTAFISSLFTRLKEALQKQLKRITSSSAYQAVPSQDLLKGKFPADKQWEFAQKLLQAMGFHSQASRLDQSAHPFCRGISPKDIRMTTNIREAFLMTHLFAVLHEGGHGLYEAGLPEEHYGSPLGEACSLGIHESQSRWWEIWIGHSLPFWQYFYPKLKATFSAHFHALSLDQFHRFINTVSPSLIRIYADEVTYSLHVILRFELEKALIEGQLKIKDLPEAWNAKMQAYLGITPTHHAEGCLQDIHWSMGAFGYFPTYTLGNLYAAQLFTTFEQHHANWQARVAQGELGFIREWLREHIHQYGRQFPPQELVARVTGQTLTEAPYLQYLEKKYTTIYP